MFHFIMKKGLDFYHSIFPITSWIELVHSYRNFDLIGYFSFFTDLYKNLINLSFFVENTLYSISQLIIDISII